MGWLDSIRGEFIDIIEWLDESSDTIVSRFERHDNEIKNGAQLIVRESQSAVFVNLGKYADVFHPGQYQLTTQNLPILSTLMGWKYGFDSPFKAEVYFVSTKRLIDLGWGTPNPIMMRDNDFGVVRVRSFGNFSIRVTDPKTFLSEVAGTNATYRKSDIQDYLRSFIVGAFADMLGEAKIPVLDLAAQYEELGRLCSTKLSEKFSQLGLELLDFVVENISLPEEVERAIDKRTSMGAVGVSDFTKFQSGIAMEDAANNPSGGASEGIGMGMGFGMANSMIHNQQQPLGGAGTPPPIGNTKTYFVYLNGNQEGPFPASQIHDYIQKRVISRETMLWTNGMANWQKAEELSDFTHDFGNTPPPPPPMG